MGAITAYYAEQRGRNPQNWFVIGMMLGVFGLLLVFILPPYETEEVAVAPLPKEPDQMVLPLNHTQKHWYYIDDKLQQQGPVDFDTIRSLWSTGSLTGESYLWCEGMEDWKKACLLESYLITS